MKLITLQIDPDEFQDICDGIAAMSKKLQEGTITTMAFCNGCGCSSGGPYCTSLCQKLAEAKEAAK